MGHYVAEQKTKKKNYGNVAKNKRKPIGKKTGRKTKRNRPEYKVREGHPLAGETVSELGATVPIDVEPFTSAEDKMWLNAPSLYGGVEHSDDEIAEKFKQSKLNPEEISLHGSEAEGIQASIQKSEELDENSLRIPPSMDEEELM
tara:strand:+ start:285 stop:719 length:435 start_codon:yes stop_codon:yes gene_type:complete